MRDSTTLQEERPGNQALAEEPSTSAWIHVSTVGLKLPDDYYPLKPLQDHGWYGMIRWW